MKIRSLNNATVLVDFVNIVMLIDPWLIGNLYKGAWSPYAKLKDLGFLKTVDVVFISHIHEDHWDVETLDLIPKTVKILIPRMKVNGVIERRLKERGFLSISMLDLDTDVVLDENITIKVISPLNSFAQDLGRYEDNYELDATNIDTSLLITDKKSKSSHLFLCDNTPYDTVRLVNSVNIELTTLWYPFNSYAQDYPLCYSNLSDSEKKEIHNEMHEKRIISTVAAINSLKPKYFFPHSADFVLNGPHAEEFATYVNEDFMDRERVAVKYGAYLPQDTQSCSEVLNAGDEMLVNDNDIVIHRKLYEWTKSEPSLKLPELNAEPYVDLKSTLSQAFSGMVERVSRFGVDIKETSDWVIIINAESLRSFFCFRLLQLFDALDLTGRKVLEISLTDKQIAALLSRELHWNNAMIGCHLKFSRSPNQFCQPLYKALNFLHV